MTTALKDTAMKNDTLQDTRWQRLCNKADLVANSGVVAWWQDDQVALIYVPKGRSGKTELYAIDNHDPFSNANVLGRGIVGDKGGEVVIASPLYKQHFRLRDGICLEDETVQLRTWQVRLQGDEVQISG
ncbi:nitrite reductase small subunit NirD [Phytohalomonas tamaricis]|uniref:nitrite reductase small subunit NirD n=1 Tax=Phytohalomonas tamaricis TaxID=2081032 RepID=UPI000D0B3BCE|nr:nitrite reductase small subunit NirD [Phytohalomonas tamaricis]